MVVRHHKNRATTAQERAYIQSSPKTVSELALELGVSPKTIRRWKNRTEVMDRPHTPHRLSTLLTTLQEALVVELRKTLLLSLDDLLQITRAFVHPDCSRSGLNRCLRRNGAARLRDLVRETDGRSPAMGEIFSARTPGVFHTSVTPLPRMPGEDRGASLFLAADRATRWAAMGIGPDASARSAGEFLESLLYACPIKISKVVTPDTGAFTAPPDTAAEGQPPEGHPFLDVCEKYGIEHCVAPYYEAPGQKLAMYFEKGKKPGRAMPRFSSARELHQHLSTCLQSYNSEIPQLALGGFTPLEAMKVQFDSWPELFNATPDESYGAHLMGPMAQHSTPNGKEALL